MNHRPSHQRSSFRRLACFLLSLLYGMGAAGAAWADDAEIFFPVEDDFEETGALNPNILFMVDTSGSMGPTSGTIDGKTRMQRLQSAFKQIMDELSPNTNVGLGRYSYFEGGAILTPVANIEAKVKDVLGEDIAIATTATPGNEAFQNNANNTVTIVTGDPLKLGRSSTPTDKYRTAIRFDGVNVPQGTTIKAAAIEFHARETNLGGSDENLTLNIQVEQADTAAPLAETVSSLSGRSYGSNSISWPVENWTSNGESHTTTDFAPLVDSVVKRSGWCGGNAILVSMNWNSGSSGYRYASSAAGNDTELVPVLRLTVDSTDPALATGCNVRERTTVSQVKASTDDAEEGPQYTIRLGGVPSASSTRIENFTGSNREQNCYNHHNACRNSTCQNSTTTSGLTTTQVEYYCERRNNSNWSFYRRTTTTTDSVQNARTVRTMDTTLDVGTPSDPGAQIVGLRFQNIRVPKGAEVLNAYLDFVSDGIDTADANFTIKVENVADSETFRGENCTTVGTPSCAYLLSVRRNNVLPNSVSWDGAGIGGWSVGCTGGCIYSSPNIKDLIQGTVNQTSWTEGNAIVLFLEGSGIRRAKSFDANAGQAPKLRVTYRVPEATANSSYGDMTMRQYLKDTIDELTANGSTPTVGALYEAASYMMGKPVYFGKTRGMGPSYNSTSDNQSYNHAFEGDAQSGTNYSGARYSRISHASTFTPSSAVSAGLELPSNCNKSNYNSSDCSLERYTGAPVYKSPIEYSCQSNSIVLLSDGEPTSNKQNVAAENLIAKIGTEYGQSCAENGIGGKNGACGREIADYIYKRDNSSALPGNQFIRTYTIAFGTSTAKPYLDSIAAKGGTTEAYSANSVSELVSAFRAITAAILDINTTFVSPAVTVNTFNRLTHRNELYFAVFRPDNKVKWQGNLKRYRLDGATGTIRDSTDAVAVDPDSGFFKKIAKSWWLVGDEADGDDVGKGGAAGKLGSARNIYTYVSNTAPANVDLTLPANAFTTTNVTAAMLGIGDKVATDNSYHGKLINWTRGLDAKDENNNGNTGESRKSYGDPLHSEPALITYGGTDANPDIAIFFGTNEGGFHAINASTGSEYWTFIPKEVLPNLDRFYSNNPTWKLRPNGLDGPITAWVNDKNNDGKLLNIDSSTQTDEHAYLYVGMRRGGRNYYALDVTQRSQPKLKFQINGGSGSYAELGETWSRAIPARIKLAGTVRDVLIFSGGYHEARDEGEVAEAADYGRALYIADASTGQRLWWAGSDESADLQVSEMIYSTPASPKAIDLNGDGIVDRIYMSDVGGQIFRFILNPENTDSSELASASRIAQLGATDSAANARRFYTSPDVALIRKDVSTPFLSISIGSGNRNHPLRKTTNDRFYVLRDPEIGIQENYTPISIVESDLYDATENLAGSADAAVAQAARQAIFAKKGFYINMGAVGSGRAGEKVITESQTFNNQVLFASYQPGGRSAAQQCSASSGLSRFYIFSLIDGQPTQDLSDGPTDPTDPGGEPTDPTSPTKPRDPDDRFKELAQGGLPPDPAILFPNLGAVLPQEALVCIGPECFNPGLNIETQKTYWLKRR